jgi:hypothetical protein
MRGTLPLGKSLGSGQRADDHAGRELHKIYTQERVSLEDPMSVGDKSLVPYRQCSADRGWWRGCVCRALWIRRFVRNRVGIWHRLGIRVFSPLAPGPTQRHARRYPSREAATSRPMKLAPTTTTCLADVVFATIALLSANERKYKICEGVTPWLFEYSFDLPTAVHVPRHAQWCREPG